MVWKAQAASSAVAHDETEKHPGTAPVATSVQAPEKRPKGFQRSDARVRQNIVELLSEHPGINATQIVVSVLDGNVTLSGTVNQREQKILAELVAIDIYGVRDVTNRVGVGVAAPTGSRREPD